MNSCVSKSTRITYIEFNSNLDKVPLTQSLINEVRVGGYHFIYRQESTKDEISANHPEQAPTEVLENRSTAAIDAKLFSPVQDLGLPLKVSIEP